ncbi:phosphoribosyltransferase [Streptomyces sp. NPDC088116]|uniref:phosphoribosyltransferase n=1 Tax=Streptomyces sp. NPDC088116 TaxID=3365825 RepID=UPI00381F8235
MKPAPVWRRDRLLTISWEAMGRMLSTMAKDIEASGFAPTVVAGIARGGLPPAIALSNLLAVEDFRILGIPRNTSNSRYSERGEAVLDYVVPDRPLTGARVLLVDDIMGDGGTMALAVSTALSLGAAEVRTAVVVRNLGAANAADYTAAEVDDWTVFPWEAPPAADENAVPLPGAR